MSITRMWEWIPPWILEALNFGAAYPKGDEDAMFALGDAWNQGAAELEKLEPQMRSTTDETQECYTGAGATAIAQEFAKLYDGGDASMQKLAQGLRDLGRYTRNGGTQIEYTKIQEAAFAALTAYAVIMLLLDFPWGEAGVPIALAAGREAVEVAAEQGAGALAREAAGVGIRTLLKTIAKQIGIAGIKGFGQGVLLDAGIQGLQLAEGNRDGFDVGQTLRTGFEFGAGAMVAAPVGLGTGRLLGDAVSPRLNRMISAASGGTAAGVGMYGAGIAWQVGDQLAHGGFDWDKVDTHFDPQLLAAGVGMGAMHGVGHTEAPGRSAGANEPEGTTPRTEVRADTTRPITEPAEVGTPATGRSGTESTLEHGLDARPESARTAVVDGSAPPPESTRAEPRSPAADSGAATGTRAGADSARPTGGTDRLSSPTTDAGTRTAPTETTASNRPTPNDTTGHSTPSREAPSATRPLDREPARAGAGNSTTAEPNTNVAAGQKDQAVTTSRSSVAGRPETVAVRAESPDTTTPPRGYASAAGHADEGRPPTDTLAERPAAATEEGPRTATFDDGRPADTTEPRRSAYADPPRWDDPDPSHTGGPSMDWLDTGGAMRPRDPGYDDAWAADAYDHFRADPTDVDAIADHLAAVRRPDGSIGYSRDEVAQVKSHLMSEEHLLRDYDNGGYTRARFDPSADQAEAWIRLREGRPLPQDLVMLEHELAESNYMRDHPDATYPEAHRHANQRYNWERDIPERTGEHYDSAGKDDHGSTGVLRPDPGGHDPGGVPVRDGRAEPGSQPGDRQEDSGIPGHRQTGGRDTAGDGGPDPASGPHGGELAEGRNHPVVEPVWNRAQAHDPRLLNEMRARVARGGHPGLEHILDRLTGNPAKGIPATPHDPDLWAEAYGEYQLGPARDQLSPHEFEAAHKYTVQSLVNSYLRDPQYDDARIDWFLKWMSYDFQGVEAVGIVTDSGPPRYRSVTELRRFAVDLWNSDRSHPLHSYLKTVLQNPDGSLKNDSSERWNEALGRHSQYSSFAYQLSGDMSASGWRNHMDLFDHAVDQPIDENIRVLRGLHDMSFLTAQDGMPLGGRDPALLKNQQQVEHGYMSTAVGESLAVIDKNPFRYRVELDVPKGSRGLWMGPRSAYGGQREVILPRNTHYVIEDVVPMADGSYLVRARVLTPQELGAPDTASG